jgi:spore germination protein GerM
LISNADKKTSIMNRKEAEKIKPKKRKAPQRNKTPGKAVKKSESGRSGDSLIPLLVILVILVTLFVFLTFSRNSAFISGLFSQDSETPPAIERPEIIQTETPDPKEKEEDTFVVTTVDPEEEEPVVELPSRELKARLFFVKVNDEGQISLKSIIRTIPYDSAPLTETVGSLMLGPDRSDLNKGLLNLIPQDSRLLSIKISGGTAYMDFSEEFRYNSLGFEGYKAQLMQLVYTATEFESVEDVQILIDGEKYDYLGAEGVYIGSPLNREHFNTF